MNGKYQKKLRIEHRAKGLCVDCYHPAQYPFARCARCREIERKSHKKYNQKKRKEIRGKGLCVCCFRVLDHSDHGADIGGHGEPLASCFSCRSGLRKLKVYASYKRQIAFQEW